MGSRIWIRMRAILIISCIIICAKTHPDGRRRRPEEHWRAGQPRDISKYQPRHLAREEREYLETLVRDARQSYNKRSKQRKEVTDLRDSCGIEGPRAKIPYIVGGQEAVEGQFPWMAALFIDDAWF